MSKEEKSKTVEDTQSCTVLSLYVKDLSFESPKSPQVFFLQNFSPKLDINATVDVKKMASPDDLYEVVLNLNANAMSDMEEIKGSVFMIEIAQAGLFKVEGFQSAALQEVLHITCPTILFPYVRETVSSLSIKGALPPLILNQVNFAVLYREHLSKHQQKAAIAEKEEAKAEKKKNAKNDKIVTA